MKHDKFGCVGTTFKTFSGDYVDLLKPDPSIIKLQDIATALSRICRFGGHCPKFYSVAEHCIIATSLAIAAGVRGDGPRAILLHDAAEAFLGDMIKPLKNLLPEYQEVEQRFEQAIGVAFNLDFEPHRDIVKHYDRIMLRAEKLTMWPEDTTEWEGFANLPPRGVNLQFLNAEEAARRFKIKAQYLRIYGSSLD